MKLFMLKFGFFSSIALLEYLTKFFSQAVEVWFILLSALVHQSGAFPNASYENLVSIILGVTMVSSPVILWVINLKKYPRIMRYVSAVLILGGIAGWVIMPYLVVSLHSLSIAMTLLDFAIFMLSAIAIAYLVAWTSVVGGLYFFPDSSYYIIDPYSKAVIWPFAVYRYPTESLDGLDSNFSRPKENY